MGQKAKNSGRKKSKTCDKLADTKSVKATGCRLKIIDVEPDNEADILDNVSKIHYGKKYSGVRPLKIKMNNLIEDN